MYRLTQSLISSWLYLYTCYETCQEEAYESFLTTLKREIKEATPEMLNGIEFETEVYKVAQNVPREPHKKWENGIQSVATALRGSQIQVRVQRRLVIDDEEFVLVGVLDALKAGTIYDVKFSNKGFGSAELAGKYLTSVQHPAYFFLVPEAYEFKYLVSDGTDIYTERYIPTDTRPFSEIATEFIHSLKAMGLFELYKENWEMQ